MLEELVDPLVAEDRDAERVVVDGDSRQEPVDGFRCVRAVPDLSAAILEPAGERDLSIALDPAAEERFRGLAGSSVDEPGVPRNEVGEFVVRSDNSYCRSSS